MVRTAVALVIALVAVTSTANDFRAAKTQSRSVPELLTDLAAQDPAVRACAAFDLRELGDASTVAIQPLAAMLGDAAPVASPVCGRPWWRGNGTDLTSPGEQAAAALVAIGMRAFQPVLNTLHSPVWAARRNAAWALGAFDDQRATAALIETLKDREPGVREQAAWALGALDDAAALDALTGVLKDPDPRVRRQAAWALGAIGDARADGALSAVLTDTDDRTREQAAWALGAIGDARALPGLLPSLKDANAGVRKQAAWAIGAIGR